MSFLRLLIVCLLMLQFCVGLEGQNHIYKHPFSFPKFQEKGCYTICIKEKNDLNEKELEFLKENLFRFAPMAYRYVEKTRKIIHRYGVKRRKPSKASMKADEKKKQQITYSNPVVYRPNYESYRRTWVLKPPEESCLSTPTENCMTWCLEGNVVSKRQNYPSWYPERSMPSNRPEGWYADFSTELKEYEEWVIPPLIQHQKYFEEVAPPSNVNILLKSNTLTHKEMSNVIKRGLAKWTSISPCLPHGNIWTDIQKSLELRGYQIPKIPIVSYPESHRKQQDTLEYITFQYLADKGWNKEYLDYEALDLLGINCYEKDTLFVFGDSTATSNHGLLAFHPIPPSYIYGGKTYATFPNLHQIKDKNARKFYTRLKEVIVKNLQLSQIVFDSSAQKIWTKKGIKTNKNRKIKSKYLKKIKWFKKQKYFVTKRAYSKWIFDERTCWKPCVRHFEGSLIINTKEYNPKYQRLEIEVLDELTLPTNCKIDTVLQENEKWVIPPKFEIVTIYKPKAFQQRRVNIPFIPVPKDSLAFYHNLLKQFPLTWIEPNFHCCQPPRLNIPAEVAKKLKEKGYFKGKIEDVITEELKKAIIQFQKDHKLPVGNMNPETLRALQLK